MEIGDRIRELRENKNMTQTELSEMLGMKTYTTVSKWEKNENFPKGRDLKRLAVIFSTTSDYLLGLSQSKTKNLEQTEQTKILTIYNKLEDGRQKKVLDFAQSQLADQAQKQGVVSRVFEQMRKQQLEAKEIDQLYEVEGTTYAAAAQGFGKGYDADDYETYTVYTDEEPPYHDYAIGVKGDSMLPNYEQGDILYIVDKGLSNYSGQLCIVVHDGETYFKKVYTEENGLRLVSLNRKYPDFVIELPPEDGTYIKVYDVVGSFTPIDN